MSDIVKKYQHYFTESVRLQEMVNEQAAYIAELEEALLALSEDLTTDEREAENDAAINKAERAAYNYLSPGNPKGMWDRKTGRPKSERHLKKGQKLEDAEETARNRADDEREHPTKIFGKGGKVVGTTGMKKANSPFKLGYVDNPNYEEGR
jgi:hypothetical protein